jgi:hypothetical protein
MSLPHVSVSAVLLPCEISSSHGGEYEAQNLLRCTAVFLIEFSDIRAASIIALMMEAARTSDTSVHIQLRTRQYIPEGSQLQIRRVVSHSDVNTISASPVTLRLQSFVKLEHVKMRQWARLSANQ